MVIAPPVRAAVAVAARAVVHHAARKALPAVAVVAKAVAGAARVMARPRPLHAAGVRAPKAAAVDIATTMRSLPARMHTWVHTWATATRATAAPATALAGNQTRCAPAWTAWLNAAAVVVVAAVVVIATQEVAVMVVDQARVAVVAGATGLVGQAVLAALLTADTRKSPASAATGAAVHVLHGRGRRAPALNHPRLHLHAVDFATLPLLPPVDDVYITLGTTMAVAGSQAAFRAVDYDAVMATARAARAAGATRCGVVTAMGADPNSRIFYNRVKGEVERDLAGLGFSTLVIARPSLLMGERRSLHQAARPAETLSLKLFTWLNPVIPASYRARPGADVARALVHAVQTRPDGLHVLTGSDLQPF